MHVNEAIERLLHLWRGGIQFIEQQAIWLVARDDTWRAKAAKATHDLRHTEQIFGGKLTAQQRDEGQAQVIGEGIDEVGFADAGWSPDEDGAHRGDMQQKIKQIALRERDDRLHGGTSSFLDDEW